MSKGGDLNLVTRNCSEKPWKEKMEIKNDENNCLVQSYFIGAINKQAKKEVKKSSLKKKQKERKRKRPFQQMQNKIISVKRANEPNGKNPIWLSASKGNSSGWSFHRQSSHKCPRLQRQNWGIDILKDLSLDILKTLREFWLIKKTLLTKLEELKAKITSPFNELDSKKTKGWRQDFILLSPLTNSEGFPIRLRKSYHLQNFAFAKQDLFKIAHWEHPHQLKSFQTKSKRNNKSARQELAF